MELLGFRSRTNITTSTVRNQFSEELRGRVTSICTILNWETPSHQVMKLLTNDKSYPRLVSPEATTTERRASNIEKELSARVQTRIFLPLINNVPHRVYLYILPSTIYSSDCILVLSSFCTFAFYSHLLALSHSRLPELVICTYQSNLHPTLSML